MKNKNFFLIVFIFFIGTNNILHAQLNLELEGNGLISGKLRVNTSTDLVDSVGILIVKNTGSTGINSNAYAIEAINDIDDNYGHGVFAKGGKIGISGMVTPVGFEIYYGVSGYATGGTGTNYGVYGEAANENISYAGYFNGNLNYTGTLSNTSDRKLKRVIKTYKNALEQVMLLKPKTYQFQHDKYPMMNLAKGEQFGFIAQELQEVLPQLVSQNVHANGDKSAETIGYLGVNYIGLIPVLTKAMQEQQNMITEKEEQIKALKNQVAAQDARLERLEKLLVSDSGIQNLHQQEIEVSKASLKQNQPNPFKGQTTIEYFLPKNTKEAQLQITDIHGKILKIETITGTGHGQINLNTKTMPRGTYPYSLIVNGQVVETKQMILEQ